MATVDETIRSLPAMSDEELRSLVEQSEDLDERVGAALQAELAMRAEARRRKAQRVAPVSAPTDDFDAQRVVVTNFDMPFAAMVVFMVKWTLASIPALIILIVLGGLVGGALGVLGLLVE